MYIKAVYYLVFIVIALLIVYSGVLLFRRREGNINDELGVNGFDSQHCAIQTKTGYFKVYEIFGIDIEHAEKREQENAYDHFHSFLKLSMPFSLVFLSMPVEIENATYNENGLTMWQKAVLQIKRKRVETIKETETNQKAYIYFNASSEEDLKQYIEYVESYFSQAVQLKELDERETVAVLKALFNPYLRSRE